MGGIRANKYIPIEKGFADMDLMFETYESLTKQIADLGAELFLLKT